MKKIYLGLLVAGVMLLSGCFLNYNNKIDNRPVDDAKIDKTKIDNTIIIDKITKDKCSFETPDKCDNSCAKNDDCRAFTPKVCININEKNQGDTTISFYSLPKCKCLNSHCVVDE
ncbi:MAG: hypothetical protein COU31_00975 [Candidatus Magasanikbacteria bacterium CG10_big_fil_rev_8_21_14_0_10_40_10]|uniref:Lipoprotein n=1 Tax=Candidatus Magasanikbacteria bacterium CG10_big_fil_rev_8_21_14_0_10_40_10 TaxID=1974648 RepID=A0A2M6W4R6_9BACT|nr:MAG: hypothetical protein COU31_00975 [Candidatus Magasanikbacteria bacterium CG10_big_fil_rev_8_21_14_0_10_40_10]